jgi:hypothetical protein
MKFGKNYELEQLNNDQQSIINTTTLSTNGERKSPSKIEESRLVDKVFMKPNAYF